MNIYLITRNDSVDYDEYDAAVVAASSPEEAKELLIKEHAKYYHGQWGSFDVKITELDPKQPAIILESFNAG